MRLFDEILAAQGLEGEFAYPKCGQNFACLSTLGIAINPVGSISEGTGGVNVGLWPRVCKNS